MEHLKKQSLEDLLSEYRSAAMAHADGTRAGEVERVNNSADQIAAIYRELRSRGPDALKSLLRFLDDINPGIRLWAASHTLEIAPLKSEEVLRRLSEQYDKTLGFDAQMTLELWQRGELEFP